MVLRPILQMRQRQKIGVSVLIRLEIAVGVAAALPAHRGASARQRVLFKIVHASADRTTQLILVIGVLLFVHEAPTRAAADNREIFRRIDRPVLAKTLPAG